MSPDQPIEQKTIAAKCRQAPSNEAGGCFFSKERLVQFLRIGRRMRWCPEFFAL